MRARLTEADPFDLPDWLGTADVVWQSEGAVRTGHLVRGTLSGPDGEEVCCDLLAVDEAYPEPVADETTRTQAHQAWRNGEVLVVEREGRTTLAVPGRSFSVDTVLDTLQRLARAVGASPGRYAARLTVGDR